MRIEEYIKEQPRIIEQTAKTVLEQLQSWTPEPFDELLLLGSGSSFNALTVASATLSPDVRRLSRILGPSTFLREIDDQSGSRPLVIVLSQSGASTTSVNAATASIERGWPTIVVTAEASSPIAQLPVHKILVSIGNEPIGPKTKGFTATLVALLAFAAHLSAKTLPAIRSESLEFLIRDAERAALSLAQKMGAVDFVAISSPQRLFGVALEGSLKISEICGVPAAAFEIEELLHGRLHGLGPNSCCIIIVSDAEDVRLAQSAVDAMGERNVRVEIINASPQPVPSAWMTLDKETSGFWSAVCAVVPLQCLAVQLAHRRGMVPETMRYPGLSKALSIKLG